MAKKKNIIPKKVAGLKIPKSLRKSKTLRSLLASPLGRDIAAKALIAGAGAAATVLVAKREDISHAAKDGAETGSRTLGLFGDAIHEGTSAMMQVVTEAARSLLPEAKPAREAPSRDEQRH